MRLLVLTPEDMEDLRDGLTINAMIEGGEEIVVTTEEAKV